MEINKITMATKLQWVETYSGYKGDERPLWFVHLDQLHEVKELLGQWRTPEGDHFKVRTAHGTIYELRHLKANDHWELERLS